MKGISASPWLMRRLRAGKTMDKGQVLQTRDLLLRPLRLRDARDFYAYARDPEVARYVFWDPHTSLAQTRSILLNLMAQSRQESLHTLAIVLRGSGRMVGTIGLVTRDWENHTAEVGFSLARDCWGQGLMTQALTRYVRFSFEQLGIHRIQAQHDALNPASGAVLHKAGLQREGLLKERIHYKNRYASVVLYAAIAREWLAAHAPDAARTDYGDIGDDSPGT